MLLLGLDIGSSSIKASIFDSDKGINLASDYFPKKEMRIDSLFDGWAEQDPDTWFELVQSAILSLRKKFSALFTDIKAIGISYQMHGLVVVDKSGKPLRKSIIWCDSRAVNIGQKAFEDLGESYCLNNLLNSPGNFTASKLKWIQDNEPNIFDNIYKIMLPGDYIAYRLTGEICTTESGLSEGIFWDFTENKVSHELLDIYGIEQDLLPDVVPTFGEQGKLSMEMATKLGLSPGIPVSYRAGDQPNNALSLNVLQPGEVAATAGTSGVVYGISDFQKPDHQSRVNTFLHVNNTPAAPRLGTLLCINGTGILNSWMKDNIMTGHAGYHNMNTMAQTIDAGSDGLMIFPFGNGAERVLGNRNPNARIMGLDLNKHTRAHLLRATQEGIVYALIYGIEIMQELGLNLKVIRAGMANMFLSKIFRESFSTLSGAQLEMYNTDGAQGAARGAGIGAGIYNGPWEALSTLKIIDKIEPGQNPQLQESFAQWKDQLQQILQED